MNWITLDIELLSDASFSVDSASTGGGQTLTWIPGATLLGAAAAALAPTREGGLTPQRFFDAFIAGGVSFADGLPLHEGQIALRMPLCLHETKGAKADKKDTRWNLARGTRPAGQLEQARDGYLTAQGTQLEITTRTAMRTAMTEDGRARDRHLYTLVTVPAGTRYRTEVASADRDLLARAVGVLKATPRLGRSRTAELGAVKVSETNGAYAIAQANDRHVSEALVLCVSDLALRDPETGAPTLDLQHLGLPDGWKLDPARCFLRSRRYSPFNGHRRRPDPERQVFVAGSVIVVTAASPRPTAQLAEWAAGGVGEHRAAGLGRVTVNPAVLAAESFRVQDAGPAGRQPAPTPNGPLFAWLKNRQAELQAEQAVLKWLNDDKHVEDLAAYKSVRRSQWGQLREQARAGRLAQKPRAVLVADLLSELQGEHSTGVTAHLWRTRRGGKTAADRLAEAINAVPAVSHARFAAAVQQLASRVTRAQARSQEQE